MKTQIIILKEIFTGKSNRTPESLVKSTGLTLVQVHHALTHLVRRKLITKTKRSEGAELRVPPHNKIYVNINKNVIPRIKDLIEREKKR